MKQTSRLLPDWSRQIVKSKQILKLFTLLFVPIVGIIDKGSPVRHYPDTHVNSHVWWIEDKRLTMTSRVGEKRYYKDTQPPPGNILKAQVEEDYLKAGEGRSFFWEPPESINTISTENIIQECFYQRNPERWGQTNLNYNPKEKFPWLSVIWDTHTHTHTYGDTLTQSSPLCLVLGSNNQQIIFKRMLSLWSHLYWNVPTSSRGSTGQLLG